MLTCYVDEENIIQDENKVDFQSVLEDCEKSASKGYRLANKQKKYLSKALSEAQDRLRETLDEFNSSDCYSPEATEQLVGQLSDIEKSFGQLSVSFKEDLKKLHKNMSKFSITLFGRTMTGKSTLMEVLTRGDGASIGKGAQRTTRDVRKYTWNNLEITDVPGIGAFEGTEDDQIAFEAAKTADLILFLITDDAPQAIDAEWFSRIIQIGKPVICVVNVKAAVTEGKSLKLIQRDIEKKFDEKRLESIKKQFLKYSYEFGQNWKKVPFVCVHLKSAYLANQASTADEREMLQQLSRIDNLKNSIIDVIETKGSCFRIKNFTDIIANPMLEFSLKLLEQSSINSAQGRTILSKKRQFESWGESFYRDGKNRIASLIKKIKSDLNSEISAFAEEHFDDNNADKAWEKVLTQYSVEDRCKELIADLDEKANDKLKELSREITKELSFVTSYADNSSLKMKKIINGKKIWEWSALIGYGGLQIASGIAFLTGAAAGGPLGWAALAVVAIGAIGSFFFKKREKKEREARLRLEKNLKSSVSDLCDNLEVQMEKTLDKLMRVKIRRLIREINKTNAVLFRLADTQRELAWELNDYLLDINNRFIEEAIKIIGAQGLEKQLQAVARIPGNRCVFMLREGVVFPPEQRDALCELICESVYFVVETDYKWLLIARVLGKGVDRKRIQLEEKIGVAHVSVEKVSPDLLYRIRAAQQLSKIQIINQ